MEPVYPTWREMQGTPKMIVKGDSMMTVILNKLRATSPNWNRSERSRIWFFKKMKLIEHSIHGMFYLNAWRDAIINRQVGVKPLIGI